MGNLIHLALPNLLCYPLTMLDFDWLKDSVTLLQDNPERSLDLLEYIFIEKNCNFPPTSPVGPQICPIVGYSVLVVKLIC